MRHKLIRISRRNKNSNERKTRKRKLKKGGSNKLKLDINQYMNVVKHTNKQFMNYTIDTSVLRSLELIAESFVINCAKTLIQRNEKSIDEWKRDIYTYDKIPFRIDITGAIFALTNIDSWSLYDEETKDFTKTNGPIIDETTVKLILINKDCHAGLCTPEIVKYISFSVDYVILTLLIELCKCARERLYMSIIEKTIPNDDYNTIVGIIQKFKDDEVDNVSKEMNRIKQLLQNTDLLLNFNMFLPGNFRFSKYDVDQSKPSIRIINPTVTVGIEDIDTLYENFKPGHTKTIQERVAVVSSLKQKRMNDGSMAEKTKTGLNGSLAAIKLKEDNWKDILQFL